MNHTEHMGVPSQPPPLEVPSISSEGHTITGSSAVESKAVNLRAGLSWKPARPNRSGYRNLWERRQKASLSIQKAEKWIGGLSSKGCPLPPVAQVIAEHIADLWAAFRATIDALKKSAVLNLPWVRDSEGEIVPRIYALARNFLRASSFDFQEDNLITYLHTVQKQVSLDMNELWALKPILQFVLFEEIGAVAEVFCRQMERATKALSLRPEFPSQQLPRLIENLQAVDRTGWLRIFEEVSESERILKEDPAGIYPQMDSESRDAYRQVVSQLAKLSNGRETEIAKAAVGLAKQAQPRQGEDVRLFERRRHVGYYLVDDGRIYLEARFHYRPPFHQKIERLMLRWPEVFYVVGIEVVTAGIIAFLLSGLNQLLPPLAAILLLLLPATESAVRIVNQFVSLLIQPRRLAKMDFSDGIPPDCTTMVVIPTLLISKQQVRETVEDLEIRFLANTDPNLHFALLTDVPDSPRPSDGGNELVELCSELIEKLNQKYRNQQKGSFFLFHRHRVYNPVEGAWMGWERKRGKLLDLNNLLRNNFDSFPVKVGDLSILPTIRYVITLDSDTNLPRETAHRLVGALAHPLNRAVIDPATNTVVKGYGILQPRVGISVMSAIRSRLASILSGQSGFDLYTRAISDLYQDLFGEGSFTGKGIYEVDVYQKVLGQRFPCNALLSHDLIEGSYARAGLVSDIEVIDDYPSHFSAYSRRKHRWVRGDWQILRWLLNRVPGFSGEPVPNPLSFIARWKILDNLRRSLFEAALLALLIGGWFFLPGGPAYWTVATLVLLLLPSYLQLFLSLISAGGSQNWAGFLKEAIRNFMTEQMSVFFTLIFLFHQTLITLDAIFRTLIRLAVTHKKLLEWETAAQAELRAKKRTPVEICMDLTPWLSIALFAAIAYFRPGSLPEALPFLVAWAGSKFISQWVDRPFPFRQKRFSPEDGFLLCESALRIWRFFREWSHAGTNWLIPDYVQESPRHVANIISPTNLGFLLTARLAAFDLGYLTVEEFAHETEQTMVTAQRMTRHKGHFLNWNRMDTLEAVEPLFISTVDSGNLAACLWTLKQGCLEIIKEPLWRGALWKGLRDQVNLLRALVRPPASKGAASILEELVSRLESADREPVAWIALLPELQQKAAELENRLSEEQESAGRDDKIWWASELRLRLASLRRMAENLMLWVLPEHRNLFLYPNTLPSIELGELSLAELPQVLADLKNRVRKLAGNPDVDFEIRSQAQSFLKVIALSSSNATELIDTLQRLAEISDSLVNGMDFRFLYNSKRKLLSIGYDVTRQRLESACYDMLASEARTAAYIAIAKGDIRQESWFQLGRSHTIYEEERTLLSWSGTMFEYLLPALWMKSYPDTILGQSQRAVVRCQQKFGRRKRRPWGVSEAGWTQKDSKGLYQYRAFGIPSLALSPRVSANVVAPYATFLALEADPEGAAQNLRRMKRMGWLAAYGFYESADYKPASPAKHAKYELVRSWMAHHQGMSLLALCNFLAGSPMQRRFHAEPRSRATEFILQERVPAAVPVVPHETPLPAILHPEAEAAKAAV